MNIQELEIKMWNAAKSRDSKAFLEVVEIGSFNKPFRS